MTKSNNHKQVTVNYPPSLFNILELSYQPFHENASSENRQIKTTTDSGIFDFFFLLFTFFKKLLIYSYYFETQLKQYLNVMILQGL